MNSTGKVILATSALGGIVGVSYLIVRSRRDPDADEATAEEADRPHGGSGTKPAPGPVTPLAEPVHPLLRDRINRSHTRNRIVQESAEELLRQARRYDPAISLDELTGARLAASEHGRGTFTELACIVDSELNRAERKGLTLFKSLTVDGKFGEQGAQKRRAATRQDPKMRHLLAARAVLSGAARGVSRGSVQFFDPTTQDRLHRPYARWLAAERKGERPKAASCSPLELLETWSFDYGKKKKKGNRCPPDRSRRGSYTLAWVGPIAGVNPLDLMLMKRMKPGPEHQRRYEEARDLLLRGLKSEA